MSLTLGFFATTAQGVSLALPMPHLSLASVSRWFGSAVASAMGTADGRTHTSGAASTKARGGALGSATHAAPGQLPAYRTPGGARTESASSSFPHGKGFDAKTSALVPSLSSARENVYKNADGSYTARLYQQAVNYHGANGAWTPIDTTLTPAKNGAHNSFVAAATPTDTTFAASGADPDLVSFQFGPGQSVSFGIAGGAAVAPTITGSTATYPSVLPGTDAVLVSSPAGVKESLVLHSSSAPTTFVYPLRLTGVTASLGANGAVDFTDAAGAVVGEIPPGEMSDSAIAPYTDQAAQSNGVSYALTTVNGVPALEMKLDTAWLDAPARQYPVTVDPTLVSSNASATTYALYPCTNDNSTDTVLKVGTPGVNSSECGSANLSAVSYLAFPSIASQLANDYVTGVSLTMYNTWSATCTPEPYAVGAVSSSWTASGITTWGNKPGYGGNLVTSESNTPGPACGTNTSSNVGAFMTANLSTATFNGWTGGTSSDYGLAVYAPTTSGGYPSDSLQWKKFASTAAGVASSNYPYLSVTYQGDTAPNITAAAPDSGQNLLTLTPELTAQAQDPDNFPGKGLKFEFQVEDDSTGTPVQVADSGTLASGEWVVPSGKLKWSGTYYWQVRAYDTIGWGAWSQPSFFGLAVQQPPVTSHLAQNGGEGFDPEVGNYTSQATDANVATVGPPLEVQRSYNSLDPRTGLAFGSGWASVLDSSAQVDGDGTGNVVLTFATGQQVRFANNGGGSYAAPSGMYATLTQASTTEPAGSDCPAVATGYCLLDKSGDTYAYTQALPSGAFGLSAIVDHTGRATEFAYNSSAQPVSMTSCVSGCLGSAPVTTRSLAFTWSQPAGAAYSHVTQVSTNPVSGTSASSDLMWTYSYTGDELTAVCDPAAQAGACANQTTYNYEAGSQYSAAALDAGPKAYWRLDDPANSTAAGDQVLANEGSDNGTPTNVTFGVTPGPLAASSGATAASFDGSSSAITLPSGLVQNNTYLSVGLWFETSAAGGPQILFSTGHSSVGTASPSSAAMPVLYVGSDGKLYGHFWNGNTAGMVSQGAVNDGQWHYAVLTAAGNTQSLYLDGKAVPGGPETGALDNVDPIDLLGAGVFNTDGWPAGGTNNTWSYFKGDIAEAAFYARPLGGATVSSLFAAQQHPSALLTGITKPSGAAQAAVSYNVPADRVSAVTDGDGGQWTVSAPNVYGSSAVYQGAVLGSSPQGYWRLNDATGTVAANQVTNTSATSTNTAVATYSHATLGASGPFADSAAAAFNGSNSSVQLPGQLLPASGPAAIELWFETSKTTGLLFSDQGVALGAGDAVVDTLYVGSDGKLHGGFWNTAGSVLMASPSTVDDGKWHDVVLSTDGADQQMYLDGAEIAQTTTTHAITNNQEPYVYIGAGDTGTGWPGLPNASTAYFNGSISDVSVYRQALTPIDVENHHDALKASSGLTPVAAVLVGVPGGSVRCVPGTPVSISTLTTDQPQAAGLQIGFAPCRHEAFTYDPQQSGRMLTSSDAYGNVTSYGYDAGGFRDTVTDPDGDVTTTGHDVRGNAVSKTTCQSLAQELCSTSYTTYWPDDQTASPAPDPRDDLMTSSRDGRSVSAADPAYMTQYTYDTNGNVTAVTDPLGRTTSTAYSAGTEAAATVTTASSGAPTCSVSTGTGATPADLPLSKTTPGGAVTKYLYYANGDLAQETSPLGMRTVYVYDGVGRVSFETQCSDTYPNGVVTAFTYDADGRVTKKVAPTTTDAVSGLQHQQTTATAYTVDGQVDHTTISDTGGSTAPDASRTTSYTYFPTGQVKTSTDPMGNATSYTYDTAGDKTSVKDPKGIVTDYAYDLNDRLIQVSTPNYTGTATGSCQTGGSSTLITDSRSYDPAGRLATELDGMCREIAYTYYDNGLAASATQVDPGGQTPGITETKQYDGAGDIVSDATGNGAGVKLTTYDAAGQVTLAQTKYAVNSSGTLLYKNTQTAYDADGRAVTVSQWQDDGSNTVQTTDYTYNAEGDKLSQSVHDSTLAQATAAGLAGSWPLTDGSTNLAADGSGGDDPAVVTGGATWTGDGPAGLGGSLALDGSSGQAAAQNPPIDTTKDYSVSAWAKLAAAPGGNETIAATPGTDRGAFFLQYSKSTGGWSFLTTSADAATTTFYSATLSGAPAVGSWVHLVGTYNAESKTIALYVNGTLAQSTSAPAAWKSTGGVTIGAYGGSFNGEIADVQLWNRTLTQANAGQLYNGLSPGAGGLAASWLLDDGATRAAADTSGNGHAATLTGRAGWADIGPAITLPGGIKIVPVNPRSLVMNGAAGSAATSGAVLNTAASYTVGAWVYENSDTAAQTFLSQDGSQASAFLLQNDPTTKEWRLAAAAADTATTSHPGVDSSSAIALNTWTYLTGVYDASAKTLSLYVNGALAGSVPYTTAWASSGAFAIGRDLQGGAANQYLDGDIEGVQAYQQALSAAQISTLYNGGSLLSSPDIVKTTWTYDQRGAMTSTTAPNGNVPGATASAYVTTYTTDQLGRQTVTAAPPVITSVGGVPSPTPVTAYTSTGYDTFGDAVEKEDADGNIAATAFNLDGQPTGTTLPSYTQPVGGGSTLVATTHTDYDADGRVQDKLDAQGNEVSYTYDQFGKVLTQADPPISVQGAPTAGTVQYQYDQDEERTQVTDPTQAVTKYQYDYLGQLADSFAEVRQPSAAEDKTQYFYNTLGDAIEQISPSGVVTKAGYDDDHEQISSTDGAQNLTQYAYDYAGRLVWTGYADGQSSSAEGYDFAGREVWSADYGPGNALIRTTHEFYDADGNLTARQDALGATETFGYNADDELTSQIEPVAAAVTATSPYTAITTAFGYDAAGNRTAIGSGAGNTTVTTYNAWGLPETTVLPAVGPTPQTATTVYDLDGNTWKQISPGGATVTDQYDALGDLVGQSGAGSVAATADRTFGYDLDARMVSSSTDAVSGSAATAENYSYDDRGDLLTASGTAGASSFTYNTDGQMYTRTDAAGTSTYTHNNGLLQSVSDPLSGVAATYTYNKLDQVSSITYGASTADARTFGYDALHRLTSDALVTNGGQGAQVAAIDYNYNLDDEETSQTTWGIGTTSATTSVANTYGYDEAGRITSWSNGTTTTDYGYDQDGNRTCVTTSASGCTTANSTYKYNARDQLTADGTNTYTYAADGTLSAKTTNATSAVEVYAFDAYQQMATDGGAAYSYDALGRVTSAVSPSGTAALQYSGTANDLASDNGSLLYAHDPDGTVIGAQSASGGWTQEAWTDQHHDLSALFGASGIGLGGWDTYDPLGNTVSSHGAQVSLGFQSGYTSGGKVDMASRWYSPATGQFDSADTQPGTSSPASVNGNTYTYANDNPLTGFDPTGHLCSGVGPMPSPNAPCVTDNPGGGSPSTGNGAPNVDDEAGDAGAGDAAGDAGGMSAGDIIGGSAAEGAALGSEGGPPGMLLGAAATVTAGTLVAGLFWLFNQFGGNTDGLTPDPMPGPAPVAPPTTSYNPGTGSSTNTGGSANPSGGTGGGGFFMPVFLQIIYFVVIFTFLLLKIIQQLLQQMVKTVVTYVYVPPPPPPAYSISHKRPTLICTGGCVTAGTPNLASTTQRGSAFTPKVSGTPEGLGEGDGGDTVGGDLSHLFPGNFYQDRNGNYVDADTGVVYCGPSFGNSKGGGAAECVPFDEDILNLAGFTTAGFYGTGSDSQDDSGSTTVDISGKSRTIWIEGDYRMDVENGRGGPQLHFQIHTKGIKSSDGPKYQYDFATGEFIGMPASVLKYLNKNYPTWKSYIPKGLKLLGLD